ncbi:MAG: hypothetical protein ISQ08_04720 [Planctomycetes bacterium]|nr:hypothetical protein [Planctomycetota bacterium]MDA0948556.1 hypothetical protein [Planctomycetota bacterium]
MRLRRLDAWAAVVALLVSLVGCEPPAPERGQAVSEVEAARAEGRIWPEDAVLAVGDEPISAADLEEWVDTFALVEPSHSRPDHLRKALTNRVLHTRVARQIDPRGYARTQQLAERALEDLRSGRGVSAEGPQVQDVSGCWNDKDQDIGMDRWGRAREWNEGEWHLLETLGGWSVVRVLDKPEDDAWLPNSSVQLQHVTFYYLEPATMKREIEDALTRMPIRVLDEEWRDVLPVWYRHLLVEAPDPAAQTP